MSDERTDFGFERVTEREKTSRVREVFDSVADRYDVMNDLMSLGLHRIWKRIAVATLRPRAGQRILDLAGGSGDLSRLLARAVGDTGRVVLSDINRSMIERGRDRLLDAGLCGNLQFVQADAEALPFATGSFDALIIGFGLRNVTRKEAALAEMHRVLRPGGTALILEFSHLRESWLAKVYDLYSFQVLPRLGRLVAGDAASYRYLAESIRMHPAQEDLVAMMRIAGFERCRYQNLAAGLVALHTGMKL